MLEMMLSEVRSIMKGDGVELSSETALVGDGRVLDSLALVELCLRLEDIAADMGFEFDWISEEAMSRSRSMFRSVGSLSEEFARQHSEKT